VRTTEKRGHFWGGPTPFPKKVGKNASERSPKKGEFFPDEGTFPKKGGRHKREKKNAGELKGGTLILQGAAKNTPHSRTFQSQRNNSPPKLTGDIERTCEKELPRGGLKTPSKRGGGKERVNTGRQKKVGGTQ